MDVCNGPELQLPTISHWFESPRCPLSNQSKTIKNILLDLNKFIMAHESKPANIRRWKKQMQELLEEDPEMKEIVFGQPRSSVYSMKFGGDDD